MGLFYLRQKEIAKANTSLLESLSIDIDFFPRFVCYSIKLFHFFGFPNVFIHFFSLIAGGAMCIDNNTLRAEVFLLTAASKGNDPLGYGLLVSIFKNFFFLIISFFLLQWALFGLQGREEEATHMLEKSAARYKENSFSSYIISPFFITSFFKKRYIRHKPSDQISP